jgi:hypothetical protein
MIYATRGPLAGLHASQAACARVVAKAHIGGNGAAPPPCTRRDAYPSDVGDYKLRYAGGAPCGSAEAGPDVPCLPQRCVPPL